MQQFLFLIFLSFSIFSQPLDEVKMISFILHPVVLASFKSNDSIVEGTVVRSFARSPRE